MLTVEQLRYTCLEATHRAFVLEERCIALDGELRQVRETNEKIGQALHDAQKLIERLRKGEPPAGESADATPLPPIVPPPQGEATPDDDGVAGALDELALLTDPVPA